MGPWRSTINRAASVQLILLGLAACLADAFRDGDYVHTSRKAQFHQQRTNWQDLVGQHCPRFGMDRLVALPIPEPQAAFEATDSYKIQLSFDGDRHLTQWLPVLGTGASAPDVPLIFVRLRRSGDEVLGVSAQVMEAPSVYKMRHKLIVEELHNMTHWPKHVLVHYVWHTENAVDLDRGLYVLFCVGIAAVLLFLLNAARGMHSKLAQFLQEVADDGTAAVSVWKGGAKGD